VVLGGRRVPVARPRARTVGGFEVPLDSYRHFAAEDQFTAVVMERMLAGLATRRHVAAGEPVGAAVAEQATATSRSAVWRRFIAATRTALGQLLARDLAPLKIKVLMIDGEHLADHLAVVALGICADGTKVPVGLWEGSTENATDRRRPEPPSGGSGHDPTPAARTVNFGDPSCFTMVNFI
jgi:transposase-like protein